MDRRIDRRMKTCWTDALALAVNVCWAWSTLRAGSAYGEVGRVACAIKIRLTSPWPAVGVLLVKVTTLDVSIVRSLRTALTISSFSNSAGHHPTFINFSLSFSHLFSASRLQQRASLLRNKRRYHIGRYNTLSMTHILPNTSAAKTHRPWCRPPIMFDHPVA